MGRREEEEEEEEEVQALYWYKVPLEGKVSITTTGRLQHVTVELSDLDTS